jgi:hypothetical protein
VVRKPGNVDSVGPWRLNGSNGRGLPCPYHSPARSETLGQASTLHTQDHARQLQDHCPLQHVSAGDTSMLDSFPLCSSLALAGRIPREPSQRAPFYEQGSPRALRGLRALLTLLWPTSCQTRPRRRPKQCAISPSVARHAQTVSYLPDVRS